MAIKSNLQLVQSCDTLFAQKKKKKEHFNIFEFKFINFKFQNHLINLKNKVYK